MKRFLLWSTLVFLFLGFIPKITEAISIYQPFGGKIIANAVPGVTCAGIGPITIRPINLLSPAGLYATTALTRKYQYRTIVPGSWVVGLYLPAMTPICFTDSVPPVPISVFPIITIGTSLPNLSL